MNIWPESCMPEDRKWTLSGTAFWSVAWKTENGEFTHCYVLDVWLLTRWGRFLAYVDLLGTTYTASTLATGYGAYIAQPLLRKAVEGREDKLTEEEAVAILEQSLRVLYYRDARSLNKVLVSFFAFAMMLCWTFLNSSKLPKLRPMVV